MSPIMDHPMFCNLAKLFHAISGSPESAQDILRQTGAELNKIADLFLNDIKDKVNANNSNEVQKLYINYQRYNQNYLILVKKHGMVIPPGEDGSKPALPVRDPTRKQKAFRKTSREESKNLFCIVQQLGVSTQNVSNQMRLMSFEALVSSPPPLPSNNSSGSSSSGGSSACSPLSMEPAHAALNHRRSISSDADPFSDPWSS
ncbi:hypothetical protein BDQ12DRAFT_730220 [Crucibulum laeve]|uniref:Uncharacterized protein n=1 Tax=Crucibulum laeve TaxID=68775 RepID=A0A5C3MHH3_9AGAR|nr:hypothetical protein BDQ12DRAFT_730220 [Crucibulum laeve]